MCGCVKCTAQLFHKLENITGQLNGIHGASQRQHEFLKASLRRRNPLSDMVEVQLHKVKQISAAHYLLNPCGSGAVLQQLPVNRAGISVSHCISQCTVGVAHVVKLPRLLDRQFAFRLPSKSDTRTRGSYFGRSKGVAKIRIYARFGCRIQLKILGAFAVNFPAVACRQRSARTGLQAVIFLDIRRPLLVEDAAGISHSFALRITFDSFLHFPGNAVSVSRIEIVTITERVPIVRVGIVEDLIVERDQLVLRSFPLLHTARTLAPFVVFVRQRLMLQ